MGSRQGVLVAILVFATFFLWNLYNILQLGNISTCEQPPNFYQKDITKCEKLNEQLRANLSLVQWQLHRALKAESQTYPNKGTTSFPKASKYEIAREETQNDIIPVIIFAYNRPEYLTRTLDTLLKYRPSARFPIIVSQDGAVEEVTTLVLSYRDQGVFHIQNKDRKLPPKDRPTDRDSYYYISQHYKFGLGTIFDLLQYKTVIILEDDLEIAPDFFDYFEATLPLLKSDPSLFCVSAFNDNGQSDHVRDAGALYRSDFFPGLGWMLTRETWQQWKSKWPGGFWDDWVREPAQRQDKQCIRPEISRTYTFGEKGSSEGQFFTQYLSTIKLNNEPVEWKKKDLSFLLQENYGPYFEDILRRAIEISSPDETKNHNNMDLILYYRQPGLNHFFELARHFRIMDDEKAGIPRTAYRGIVTFYQGDNRIFLAPNSLKSEL